jgi:hypothetical protein
MAKARCKGKTKAGKACKSPPIKGEEYCLSHAPKALRAKLGFGGPENGAKGGHAKRVPRLTELLCAEVEERAEEIIEKLFSGLDAHRAVVVGTGPKARLEFAPDPDLALKTVREIFDRHDGRPRQAVELSGEGGGPVELEVPTDAVARSTKAAKVLDRARKRETKAASANGSG